MLEPDDIRSTAMGQQGEDIQLSPAARKVFPYQIECKAKGKSAMHTWYDQAKTHGSYQPLLIVKQDRKEILVAVTLEHFLELIKNK